MSPPSADIVCDMHSKILDDHEGRLRTLERAYWKQGGIIGAISGLLALLGALIGSGKL